MDLAVKNGSGFAGQYPREYSGRFEVIDTTPVEFLLWYHHVNYTHTLPWGTTVIQHLYDLHYTGAETAQTFPQLWKCRRGIIDKQRYDEVLAQLIFQAGHSIVWRDSIVYYYNNLTRIPDERGRVGKHPFRIEAESMELRGYEKVELDPIESASNALAVQAIGNHTQVTAEAKLEVPSGVWNIDVVYFDVIGGIAQWEAFVNNRSLGKWLGNAEDVFSHASGDTADGATTIRVTFENVRVKKGDVLKVVAMADGWDITSLDYVVVFPAGIID